MTEPLITADWETPTTILIGNKRIREVIPRMQEAGLKSILVICDTTMIHSAVLKNMLKYFERASFAIGCFCLYEKYADKNTLKIATRIFDNGNFDSIIGLGRSGALDLAKLIALNTTQGMMDNCKLPPVYTIPVGSNNGAEISDNAFLTEKEGAGQFISTPQLRPRCVILDPSLLPENSTSVLCATAMTTLAQALTDWCSDEYNPIEKAIAEQTIRIIFNNLPIAIKKPSDINSRIALMSATVMAHSKNNNKLSVTVAFSQTIQKIYNIDSGLVAGVLLPHILTAKYSQFMPKLSNLSKALNIDNGFDGFLGAFLKLRKNAGIPAKLGHVIGKQKLKNKEKLLIESYALTYPIRTPHFITQKRTIKILNAAMSGKILREKENS